MHSIGYSIQKRKTKVIVTNIGFLFLVIDGIVLDGAGRKRNFEISEKEKL